MQPTNTTPALVLLHGFCEDSTLWDYLIPLLEYDGEITAPNLPGFGKASLVFSGFNLENIAQQIRKKLL